MVYILTHLLLSFIASASFGVIFNAPRQSLIQCGFVGMIGWISYILLADFGVDAVQASFVGAFAVALIGHVMAKRYKMPMIIFSVAGIIPLVPGGLSYDTMRHVAGNDYLGAIPLAAKAFMISGAIAMGLVFAEVFVQLFLKGITYLKGQTADKKQL
ncbi:threonine/serine exporter family protein [Bacillus aquiflavi]|uniref:Threonine/serine exporter n=1 Tax=Bacillus aquiflavi TaxID=2672567 RepID=A0A6B3W5S1_9BACI|nr:threonine/serine exporter family protein [Bacillus aquiflavi]MBA4538732.1 threonine/serine exporter family protein [Bacillus aquiflavi]NEY83091.1 threonine/serine exporter [Bacillus aquiflavi]UAC48389.1 threonine/serine exporter family protein [Bacillus aquiflavi]